MDKQKLAKRTYNRVLLGKDIGLVANSCDFRLLEKKYREYIAQDFFFRAMIQPEALSQGLF